MISENSQYEDLKDLLFGRWLGMGIARKVGVFKPDPSLVIKCAIEDPTQNVIEWRVWDEVRDAPKIAPWFAPCVAISPCGMFLLQKRVEARPLAEYPKLVPSFFGDMKYSNYGFLNGHLVACDYGSKILTNGFNPKMKKANWWGDNTL